ncbi:MAG: serine/threonine-protein kinase, partial [Planctomycetota bacterium]
MADTEYDGPRDPESWPTIDPGESPEPATDPGSTASEDDGPGPEARLGPYTILEEIGRGGMGVVYKAFHPQLKRTVALKVLIAGEDASEEAIARFHREAESVAKLGHHPNIVPVYDIGAHGNRHYFAMHLVEGKPLDELIDAEEITPKSAARITRKLAEALHHAHGTGVLHRDVKPANILVTNAGEPQLTDFGLAKDVTAESSMTRSGVTLGTPSYMPPEQADGRVDEIDERSDVYSLGATFYEMLTTRPPFDGATVAEVIHKVLFRDPVPPRRGNPAVLRDLETICLACLEKAPERRYGDAKELAEDLGRFLDGRPIQARPATVFERLWKRARRNRALTAALIALVVLLTGATVVGSVLVRKLTTAEKTKQGALEDAEITRREYRRAEKAAEVMLGATLKLGNVQKSLKEAYHGPKTELDDQRKAFREAEKAIEEFARGVPDDEASRATLLAVQGWLLYLGGFGDKGLESFAESRRLAPDLPWAYLFEAGVWMTQILLEQPMPRVNVVDQEIIFRDMETEKPQTAADRRRLEGLLKDLQKIEKIDKKMKTHLTSLSTGLAGFWGGDLEAAENGLDRALEVSVFSWLHDEIRLARAKVRYLRFRFAESLEDLEALVKAQPNRADNHHYLAATLLAMGHVRQARREPHMELLHRAETALAEAIRIDDSGGVTRVLRGTVLTQLGEEMEAEGRDALKVYRRALEDFDTAVDRRPEDPWAFHMRGNLKRRLGNAGVRHGIDPKPLFREAVRDYMDARRLDPGLTGALSGLGSAYMNLAMAERGAGRYPEEPVRLALQAFEQVLRESPRHTSAHAGRVRALYFRAEGLRKTRRDNREALEKAIRAAREALEVEPEWVDVRNTLAAALGNLGERKKAGGEGAEDAYLASAEEYTKVLEIDPGFYQALANRALRYLDLADLYLESGREFGAMIDRAEADCTRALEIRPGYATAYFNRGE